MFEDTKCVNRIHKSKKDRQHNGQKKKKDNDLPNTMQKTNDRATRTPIKTGVNSDAPIGLAGPDPIVTHVMLLLNDTKSAEM